MIFIYMLWLVGIIFGILAVAEIAVIVYRITKKNENVKKSAIFAVLFAIIGIICTCTAVYLTLEKVFSSDISITEIGEEIGEKSGEVTSKAYKSFKKTWKDTLEKSE